MEHDSFTWCVWFTKTLITKEISKLLALRIWWGLFGRPFVLLLDKMLHKRGFPTMSQWNSGGYRAKEYLRERELFSQKLSIHHATYMKLHWYLGPNIDSKGVKQSSWKGEHWYFLKCAVSQALADCYLSGGHDAGQCGTTNDNTDIFHPGRIHCTVSRSEMGEAGSSSATSFHHSSWAHSGTEHKCYLEITF